MEKKAIVKPYYDLKNGSRHDTGFFFLNHILRARSDLHLESGTHEHDQEVNVYVAGLMNSLVDAGTFPGSKEYISIFDIDVQRYLEQHPGGRSEYVVYRDNADFGLLMNGVFLGFVHPGSYQRSVMPDAGPADRIALYYELAASALGHLQGTHQPLITVFSALAEQVTDVLHIVRRAAGYYFEFLDRMSDGSQFHLEQEMNGSDPATLYRNKLDDFLAVYSRYKTEPTEQDRSALRSLAGELSALNEKFRFRELE